MTDYGQAMICLNNIYKELAPVARHEVHDAEAEMRIHAIDSPTAELGAILGIDTACAMVGVDPNDWEYDVFVRIYEEIERGETRIYDEITSYIIRNAAIEAEEAENETDEMPVL